MKKSKNTDLKRSNKCSCQISGSNFLRTMIQIQILWVLLQKPIHGYDMAKKIFPKEHNNFHPSKIYPFLASLEKKGFIKSKTKLTGGRKRKEYSTTINGKKYLYKFKDSIPMESKKLMKFLSR
ncbi:PadR family transcriptional regulator [Candidatus Micrarchaeota archaeon]|jgi:DNA-binding PadR family transcriptional regulator|nr:PadR family transcriptional regulator [Candidatus Micrarchaeota archaeon]